MIFYVISIVFAMIAMFTNNLAPLIAAMIITGIAIATERIGK